MKIRSIFFSFSSALSKKFLELCVGVGQVLLAGLGRLVDQGQGLQVNGPALKRNHYDLGLLFFVEIKLSIRSYVAIQENRSF